MRLSDLEQVGHRQVDDGTAAPQGAPSPDGRFLVAAARTHLTVRRLPDETLAYVLLAPSGWPGVAPAVSFDASGRLLGVASGTAAVFDLTTGREIWRYACAPGELWSEGVRDLTFVDGAVIVARSDGVYRHALPPIDP